MGFGLKDLGSNPNVYQPGVPGQWADWASLISSLHGDDVGVIWDDAHHVLSQGPTQLEFWGSGSHTARVRDAEYVKELVPAKFGQFSGHFIMWNFK